MPQPGDGAPRTVTLIPGDGIGPLGHGSNARPNLLRALRCSWRHEERAFGVIEWIRKNKICLKGGLKTPVSGGMSSLNVQLRKELDLYAFLVNCFNLPGLPTRHEDVDIVVVRENRTPRGSTRASSTRSSKASR